MDSEEKKLRERARLIDESYAFWDEKVCSLIHLIDSMERSYETPEGFYEHSKAEEELRLLLNRASFEEREMNKLEKDIKKFIGQNEEAREE